MGATNQLDLTSQAKDVGDTVAGYFSADNLTNVGTDLFKNVVDVQAFNVGKVAQINLGNTPINLGTLGIDINGADVVSVLKGQLAVSSIVNYNKMLSGISGAIAQEFNNQLTDAIEYVEGEIGGIQAKLQYQAALAFSKFKARNAGLLKEAQKIGIPLEKITNSIAMDATQLLDYKQWVNVGVDGFVADANEAVAGALQGAAQAGVDAIGGVPKPVLVTPEPVPDVVPFGLD